MLTQSSDQALGMFCLTIGLLPALAPLSLECFLFPDQALVPGRRIAPLGPRASLPAFLMLLHSAQHKLGPIGEISFLSVPHHAPVLLPSSVYTVYAQPCMCSAWSYSFWCPVGTDTTCLNRTLVSALLLALPSAFPRFVSYDHNV